MEANLSLLGSPTRSMCLPQGTHLNVPEVVKALTRDRQNCNRKPGTFDSQRPAPQS